MRYHRLARTGKHSGLRRMAVAGTGMAVLAGIGLTASAYSDAATANLGTGVPGSGVGDPRVFDIAILDAERVLQDAPDAASAVVLPLTSGEALSEEEPVEVKARVANRQTSIVGDLVLRVYDADAGEPWEHLRFTVYLDDAPTPAISAATAEEVNAGNLAFHDVVPGEEHEVRMAITLATGSSAALAGKSSAVGLRFDGESR